ncbi:Gp15 family bacteriophage protein [Sporosarcina sp. NCCP-2222]|uniref:Gp15 family bacteriophage protein n=1 Tax=Sporosarcina sp. NCCP-2222 TaxID=2935073 RepID=UPI0020BD4C8B|nr:Gp15 family bacteriophage protein [Sporosarcina sp. NCCP-2222]
MYEDWGLIEASFAQQYNIRLRAEEEMTWGEFTTLLSGIMPETPLGQVISIRSENDKEILKNFNAAQRKMRDDWRSRMNKAVTLDKKEAAKQVANFQQAMKAVFSR